MRAPWPGCASESHRPTRGGRPPPVFCECGWRTQGRTSAIEAFTEYRQRYEWHGPRTSAMQVDEMTRVERGRGGGTGTERNSGRTGNEQRPDSELSPLWRLASLSGSGIDQRMRNEWPSSPNHLSTPTATGRPRGTERRSSGGGACSARRHPHLPTCAPSSWPTRSGHPNETPNHR